jgi:FAD/FMN-containing dehydrogenase
MDPASMTTTPTHHPATTLVDKLRGQLTGEVIAPDDAAYDQARRVHAAWVDRRPAVVVRPADTADVACSVAIARETGLPLAVRSGGHSVAGHSVCDAGITLDLSDLRRLDIDVDQRTAWAQTGLTAGQYTAAVGAHGLATGFGDTASVGIGGLTLGGGMGFLSRKHGLTIDSLLAAEVVTADGLVRRVDAEHEPDLFWGIRGGGGNFGVATRVRFRLHEVGTVVAGLLALPATAQTVASFVAEAEAAPEELSAVADVLPAPPLPFLPAEAHGQPVIIAALCCTGPPAEAERTIAAFRALAAPLLDLVERKPYAEVFPPEEELPPFVSSFHPLFLDGFDRDAAELVLDRLAASTAAIPALQLRVLGGAITRVPSDATAYAHRSERILAVAATFYERPEETPEHEAWAADLAAALPGARPGAYVNFLGEADERRVRDAYPGATWERLVAVKTAYDPTNLFRGNHNIAPRS